MMLTTANGANDAFVTKLTATAALPTLAVNDVSLREGNAGTASAVFTVSLSAASTQTVTVNYATANGTAAAGSDYQAAVGTLTFAPGQTSKTIAVLVNGDRLGEPNETFLVNLSSPTNADIADGQGVGTIVDDEPRLSISDVTKAEGNSGRTLFTFTVTLSVPNVAGGYDQAVTMSYQTVNGTAKSGSDYVAKTGTLTFNPGETTKTITIEVIGDTKKEANETFSVDLYGISSNGLFTKSRGIGTILNDDVVQEGVTETPNGRTDSPQPNKRPVSRCKHSPARVLTLCRPSPASAPRPGQSETNPSHSTAPSLSLNVAQRNLRVLAHLRVAVVERLLEGRDGVAGVGADLAEDVGR